MHKFYLIILASALIDFSSSSAVFADTQSALIDKANGGDSAAQYELGLAYEHGNGVSPNIVEAIKWLKLSAQNGNSAAEVQLAYIFQTGKETPKDPKQAMKYRLAAAEHGNVLAQRGLTAEYREGIDVPKDMVLADMWACVLSLEGDPSGQILCNGFQQDMTSQQVAKAKKLAAVRYSKIAPTALANRPASATSSGPSSEAVEHFRENQRDFDLGTARMDKVFQDIDINQQREEFKRQMVEQQQEMDDLREQNEKQRQQLDYCMHAGC